jgi:hypothetical protein
MRQRRPLTQGAAGNSRGKGADRNVAAKEKMHELGSPIDLSVAEEERGLEINQLSPVCDTNILDLDYGRSGCFFYVAIINQTSRPISTASTLNYASGGQILLSTGCPILGNASTMLTITHCPVAALRSFCTAKS